ncbi:MAG: carboxypeptidase regulatory-like domain-containing protein [Gemmatimonadaceae bacterium]|nr:carboxypeptidase regulatory-like domain-containing protein [Gemmatimonadaceae bacterium]
MPNVSFGTPMPRNRLIFLPLVALLALPAPGLAQKPDGRLVGAVIDRSSNGPIAAATVVFLGDGRAITTDSTGAFRFDRLPTGLLRFLVRAQGFSSFGLVVAIGKGEVLERRVVLDSITLAAAVAAATAPVKAESASRAQSLPMVSVEAAPSLGPRFANFERRRKTGAGQYIVREDIEKGGYSSLQDVARGMRGVTVECGGGSGCHIRMVRAPMRCLPEYVVDDNVDNIFGPTIPVRDIEALEVYTGPADVPGEYAGRNAGCGVIVIWTKSGPTRRKK